MFVFSIVRWLPSWRCLCHLVTLLAYVCATVGLPAGDRGRPNAGCQCGAEEKQANLCCCAKKLAHLKKDTARSCCESSALSLSPPKTQPKSKTCCAGSAKPKPKAACCSRNAASAPSDLPCVSACGCDGEPVGGMLCCSDPRLLEQAVQVPSDVSLPERFQSPAIFLPQQNISPETPPPKAQTA